MKNILLICLCLLGFAGRAQVVAQMVLCAKVEKLQPETPKYQFKKGETVYCWLKVEGAAPGSPILFEWYLGDRLMHQNSIVLDYASMRTFSYKEVSQEGAWKVIVRGPAGNPLRAMAFSVGNVASGGSQTAISDPKG